MEGVRAKAVTTVVTVTLVVLAVFVIATRSPARNVFAPFAIACSAAHAGFVGRVVRSYRHTLVRAVPSWITVSAIAFPITVVGLTDPHHVFDWTLATIASGVALGTVGSLAAVGVARSIGSRPVGPRDTDTALPSNGLHGGLVAVSAITVFAAATVGSAVAVVVTAACLLGAFVTTGQVRRYVVAAGIVALAVTLELERGVDLVYLTVPAVTAVVGTPVLISNPARHGAFSSLMGFLTGAFISLTTGLTGPVTVWNVLNAGTRGAVALFAVVSVTGLFYHAPDLRDRYA